MCFHVCPSGHIPAWYISTPKFGLVNYYLILEELSLEIQALLLLERIIFFVLEGASGTGLISVKNKRLWTRQPKRIVR